MGYFDVIFDDKNMLLCDCMEIICNMVRVCYWNVGIKWFFICEEVKLILSMMFNCCNFSVVKVYRFV